MYSLEKHLQTCSLANQSFAVLYSIWTLNRGSLPNAQNAISFNFPHYSLHEKSHSETIIKNIELFLGEDRIKQLSPTDTWLIMMAAHTHDLGMVLFNEELEKIWGQEKFQQYLEDISNSTYDRDLQKAAKILLKVQHLGKDDQDANLIFPLDVRHALISVVSNYYRPKHHERSRAIIIGDNSSFYNDLNGFNMTGIPNRFSVILSEVAYAHGIDFYSFIDRLDHIADGYGNDRVHPRFIASLLRLGDLLDVDDKRFNIFINKSFSDELPNLSRAHYKKHASVKHLLVSPNSIEVTVDCGSDLVYREARSWFDFLQVEVSNQSKEWAHISPENLIGIPPTISRNKIKVLYKGVEPKNELLNLKFSISSQRVFEIFEGSAIYSNAINVFLRELVQNSLDASKIQLWKMVHSGTYDHLLRKYLLLEANVTHEEIIAAIKFPSDIPKVIWEMFQIHLEIDWKDKERKYIVVKITDSGTGISEKDLVRMTSHVGESRNSDDSYIKFRETLPFWLKPTGAFGIGLQSIFIITDNFNVKTKTESETSKEIEFHSAKFGEYCKIINEDFPMSRGTVLTLDFPTAKFKELYENTFDGSIVYNYDYFTDKYKDIYVHKMIKYMKDELEWIDSLKISLMEETLKESVSWPIEEDFGIQSKDIEREDKLLVKYIAKGEVYDDNYYQIDENICVGSEIWIKFVNEFPDEIRDHNSKDLYADKYLVRNIPVSESFQRAYILEYLYIVWNLTNQQSDKILNISRDKFIEHKRADLNNDLRNKILLPVIEKILKIFEKRHEEGESDLSDAYEYFFIEMTAKMLSLSINSLDRIYKDYLLPEYVVTTFEDKPISFKKFLTSSIFGTISSNNHIFNTSKKALTIDAFKEYVGSNRVKADLICWEPEFFNAYLNKSKFNLRYIYSIVKDKSRITIRIYEKDESFNPVITDEIGILDFYRRCIPSNHSGKSRDLLYPLDKYYKYLSVKGVYEEMPFSHQYERVNHHIISPFTSGKSYDIMLKYLKDNNFITEVNIKKAVKSRFINHLVPDDLISFIIKNNANVKHSILTKDLVLDSYIDLIANVFLLDLKNNLPDE